jgi:hypothetical protein
MMSEVLDSDAVIRTDSLIQVVGLIEVHILLRRRSGIGIKRRN